MPKSNANEVDLRRLEWLVGARSRNQVILFRLLAFGDHNKGALITHRVARPTFLLLVGAAFSLWRAAFLSESGRTWEGIIEDANTVLTMLVQDNAIGYHQDRATSDWMSGYYMNSAKLRLLRAWYRHLGAAQELAPESLRRVEESDEAAIGGDESEGAMMTWDATHNALEELFDLLQHRLKASSN